MNQEPVSTSVYIDNNTASDEAFNALLSAAMSYTAYAMVSSELFGISYLEFKIRLVRLSLSFRKQQILYSNSQTTVLLLT